MTAVLASVAAGRSVLHWLHADLFLICPDESFVTRLLGDLPADPAAEHPVMRELAGLRAALPRDACDITALAIEYTRLFGAIGRDYGPPPPYESVHRDTSDEAVSEFYAAAGLVAFDTAAPPDHLGVEFRLMALLCHGESAAWRDGHCKRARSALESERMFLDRHLLAWAPCYLNTLEREARHPFYRALAGTARRFACSDRAVIGDMLTEVG
jgi:putative dimethyl sulfoxide reductase chaperone